MINNLYQEIAAALKTVRRCPVHTEEVPQGFKVPAWMIIFYSQTPSRGINTRRKNTVKVDVLYFPEDGVNAKWECWSVSEELGRLDLLGSFKVKNRNFEVVDNVLHFKFDVDYREIPIDITPKMQDMSQDTDLKEKE